MIVRHVRDGWEVIFQPAHGLLAGALAEQLATDRRSAYWFETKTAVAKHEDSKVAFRSGDRNYVTEAGAPKDFTQVKLSARERFVEVRERLENAYRQHRWIGLLESHHADFLYQDRDVSKSLSQLLEGERERTLSELKLTQGDLLNAYDYHALV